MSQPTPDEAELIAAAETLLDTTKALAQAMLSEAEEDLERGHQAREQAFEAFKAVVGDNPPQRVRAIVSEVLRQDARLIRLGRKLQEHINGQRELVSRGRQAARAVAPPPEPPRFVARRV